MSATYVTTATHAGKNFSEMLHRAHYAGAVTIEKNGRPYALLSPIRTPLTGAQILRNWRRKKRASLPPAEADKFADDIKSVRAVLNVPPAITW